MRNIIMDLHSRFFGIFPRVFRNSLGQFVLNVISIYGIAPNRYWKRQFIISRGNGMDRVVKNETIQIDRLTLGPYETNSYILTCPRTGDSVLVDAPAEASQILKALKDTHPRYILITHNHMDHIGALSELKSELSASVGVHHLDAKGLPVKADVFLEDGGKIDCGSMGLKILHTPGHTPGSLSFLIGNYLIAGDTLFPGGPGKTRSPADLKRIIESISRKIFVLPDGTAIYPGHGDSTVLRKEREAFAIFSSRSHDPNLFGDVLWLSS
jgi:glyoxylase-like metal-dependent hydrolase (beta-lactamase superfamily II)